MPAPILDRNLMKMPGEDHAWCASKPHQSEMANRQRGTPFIPIVWVSVTVIAHTCVQCHPDWPAQVFAVVWLKVHACTWMPAPWNKMKGNGAGRAPWPNEAVLSSNDIHLFPPHVWVFDPHPTPSSLCPSAISYSISIGECHFTNSLMRAFSLPCLCYVWTIFVCLAVFNFFGHFSLFPSQPEPIVLALLS